MIRRLLGALLLGVCVSSAFARVGVVRTTDGRSIEGDVTEKEGVVTVATRGGTIALNRSDVASIDYANIIEAYEQRLAAIPPDAGAPAHYELARWLYDNRQYELARTELNKALELNPNFPDAVLLKQTVERNLAWDRSRPAAPAPGAPTASAPPATAPGQVTPAPAERRLLNPDQINTIRQVELKESDRQIRTRFVNDVQRRYIEYRAIDPRLFTTLSEFDKAMAILQNGTPEMKPDVRIVSDPRTLLEFRTRIQPTLLQGCASVNCHGGANAGSFVLINPAAGDPATYTNFYILSKYATQVGDVSRKMLDRQYPRNSLAGQFGLPRDRADLDHPEAQGWSNLYRGLDDPRYLLLLQWIASLDPIGEYGIDFPLPTGKPSTRPTSPPAPVEPAASTVVPATPPPPTTPAGVRQEPADDQGVPPALQEIRDRVKIPRGF